MKAWIIIRAIDGKPGSQKKIADRGIAASFVGMHFNGGTPDEPNVVGYANGNYVLVISERSLKNKY